MNAPVDCSEAAQVLPMLSVRSLPGGDGRLDAGLEVVPADDLEVDLDAGLVLELLQLRGQDFLVVVKAGALVTGPVGEGGSGAACGTGIGGATATAGGGNCKRCDCRCCGKSTNFHCRDFLVLVVDTRKSCYLSIPGGPVSHREPKPRSTYADGQSKVSNNF
jgi:hypothetical protein